MALAKLQLRRVFDGHDAFVIRQVAGQHVEQGRLAAARPAADHHVGSRQNAGFQETESAFAAASEPDQVLHGQRAADELPNVEQRPVNGHRRYGDMNA